MSHPSHETERPDPQGPAPGGLPAGVRGLGSLQRELGVRDEGLPGPLVLVTAGMHGNEPAGVAAVQRLLEALEGTQTGGRLVALAGNLGALRTGERHRGQDLNRLWTESSLFGLAHRSPLDDRPDEVELRALFSLIETERDAARARARSVVHLDLHSTSAKGGAFSVVPDSIPSRRLARSIGLPVVLGLEQRIEGPLMTWLVSQGDTATVVEGGQHDDAATADVLYDALWVALDHVGVLPEGDERVTRARSRLVKTRGEAPMVLDMVYAHVIDPNSGFVMEPGWSNFRTVVRGQTLALQLDEVVQAPLDGYMLMPLYQGLGTEGFFLCRPVGGLWLFASRVLRCSVFEKGLWLLPWVHSLDSRAGEIVVKRSSPQWLNRVLHLFGFRKNAPIGERTVWNRRPQK